MQWAFHYKGQHNGLKSAIGVTKCGKITKCDGTLNFTLLISVDEIAINQIHC